MELSRKRVTFSALRKAHLLQHITRCCHGAMDITIIRATSQQNKDGLGLLSGF
jgi:hypothetical protein